MGKKRFECRNCAQAWKERREKREMKKAKLLAKKKAAQENTEAK